ncbi:AfsR/SARP family transcriptional regulator [Plantactinospora endophytica]|uniref:SARP family transcriptional regulator n=1 Tax=Plantactinospora endophytica TaxID=673535 RepID=A0ABQ4EC23_9ACTN|nr:AfsR/SARP family transcriptional regulator [Plantactinospora endophytica]GIG92283.1 SARP family transcriptional regulator [Plantactinospora endophytica]
MLGPLEALADGRRIELGGSRQQIVLASLLLEANRVVPIARLIDAIYGDDVPSTSRAQIQICISSLRRAFALHSQSETIVTRSKGYVMELQPGALDLHQYDDLVAGARRARDARQPEEAVRQYRAALRLWRGPALEDIDSAVVQNAVSRFNERRISIAEDCIELELGLGQHRDLVVELTELIAQHPLRERLRGQLMLALYRSGRQAEALEVYRSVRHTMIEELGIEPNEWLQRLEHGILTSDASLQLSTPVPVVVPVEPVEPAPAEPRAVTVGFPAPGAPNMLPTDIGDFTGRIKHVDAIQQRYADAQDNPDQLAVPVVVVVGKPGVGKTTLAVHVAHRVSGDFPDGQLFADLHGRGSQRVGPMQVLERFLRTLGVPGNGMPDGLEERAEMYRDLLSNRRVLIVLDNVDSEAQVLPLLPGNPRSAVMITSQSRLSGIPGAVHVDVGVFDARQSIELLSRIVGIERVLDEPDAAVELGELCGHLPLALRIAGARLAARPHWTLEQLVDRLANGTRRLDELKHGGMGIRASISLAYDAVDDEAKRLFRRLAVVDLPTFSGWVSAALLDKPLYEAQDLLDSLADAQLVETTDAGLGLHSQYRFHDLIRVFARERLAAEECVTERNAALERVLGALLFLSSEAHRRVYGGNFLHLGSTAFRWRLPDELVEQLVTPPLRWFERERSTIVAGIRRAAQAGLVDLCWDLAITAVTLFESRLYLNDWRETHEIALAAARQADNRLGQAAMLYSTGSLSIVEQRFGDARSELENALELFQAVGDDKGQALAVRNLAFLDRMGGDLDRASRRYEHALEVFRRDGDLVAAAYVLHSLAQVRLEGGRLDAAKQMLTEALALSRRAGSRRVEAQVLHRFGGLHQEQGSYTEAVEVFGQALEAVRDIGDPVGEAYVLHGLGAVHLGQKAFEAAGAAFEEALGLAGAAGERLVEARVLLGLGELALAQTKPSEAVDLLRRSLGLFRGMRAPSFEAKALSMLADAAAAAGGRGGLDYAIPVSGGEPFISRQSRRSLDEPATSA